MKYYMNIPSDRVPELQAKIYECWLYFLKIRKLDEMKEYVTIDSFLCHPEVALEFCNHWRMSDEGEEFSGLSNYEILKLLFNFRKRGKAKRYKEVRKQFPESGRLKNDS